MRLREYFVGIPKDRKNFFINRNRGHCPKHPVFSNKEDRKPIIAYARCQIDLVFEKKPTNMKIKT